ncbi:MAG: type II toxin-antitoxin system RelE/ParE family toxin [Vicinamibacterales bacterium]
MRPALRVEVSDVAANQIRAAEAWWRVNRPKAPNAVREEVERGSALLAAQPDIGERARGVTLDGVRRIHLRRIRYFVYYRLSEKPNQLDVLGFWHSSRHDDPPIG